MIKRFVLELLYATGALSLYHRVRNRRALTVIALHRVLARDDPRWRTCDPLYTLNDVFFDDCLAFLARHYHFVSLAQVEAARSGVPLPPRPLLLTFDDGWADNHRYALPALLRRRLPAALFVAADVIGRHAAFFQEQIIAAWRAGRLREDALQAVWESLGPVSARPPDLLDEAGIRALVAALQSLAPERRMQALAAVQEQLKDGQRQMLSVGELLELHRSGFAVGTHGKMHESLLSVPDVDAELREAREKVAGALALPQSEIGALSFPFSKYDASVVAHARAIGYRLQFGGGLVLTPLDNGLPDLLGRVGITEGEVADSAGRLRAAALAAYLFRRPLRTLASA